MTLPDRNQINAPYGPYQDFFRNGYHDVNQRGATASTVVGIQVSDGHEVRDNASTLVSQSLLDFAPGDETLPGRPQQYMRIQFDGVSAGVNNYALHRQKFPHATRFTNSLLTYDKWVRPQFNMSVGLEWRLDDDNGGADNIAGISSGLKTLQAGVWQRLTFVQQIPSWSPVGLGALNRLEALLWLSIGSSRVESGNPYDPGTQTGYLDMCVHSLTPGDNRNVKDLKAPRNPDEDLLQCSLAYTSSYPKGVVPGTPWESGRLIFVPKTDGGGAYNSYDFTRRMLTAPDVEVFSTLTGASGKMFADVFGDVTGDITAVSAARFTARNLQGVGANRSWVQFHYTAEIPGF